MEKYNCSIILVVHKQKNKKMDKFDIRINLMPDSQARDFNNGSRIEFVLIKYIFELGERKKSKWYRDC